MKIKVAVTDGAAALYREHCGEEWQNVMEHDVTELNRLAVQQLGSDIRDYSGDDFPFTEWAIKGVVVMFMIYGRGAPPQFILRGEWERMANPPPNRSNVFQLSRATLLELDVADAANSGGWTHA